MRADTDNRAGKASGVTSMVRVQVLALALVLAMTVTATSSGQSERSEQDVVSASTLTRTHTSGAVTDVEVQQSSPAGVFDTSAVEALRQWKFEPVQRDGKKIAQRAEIRMNYALPK
jgi:TonB family protein